VLQPEPRTVGRQLLDANVDEMRKQILAVVLEVDRLVMLDNLETGGALGELP
jgi:hypothetical protein